MAPFELHIFFSLSLFLSETIQHTSDAIGPSASAIGTPVSVNTGAVAPPVIIFCPLSFSSDFDRGMYRLFIHGR